MADLDTVPKRSSSVGLVLRPIVAPPLPDGALDSSADRQHMAATYAGIAAQVLLPGGPSGAGGVLGINRLLGE